jgi:plasmid stability protein
MATLYVENVPNDLYKALRERARKRRRSIAAEVVSLLEENIPTEKELESRRAFVSKLERQRSRNRSNRRFPSTEEMQREDRAR